MSILENLRAFNRKERFYLVGLALGNPAFKLGEDFRAILGSTFGLTVPADAFVAMDYHLDWLYASLVLTSTRDLHETHENHNEPPLITANQEDVDLLVAYEAGGTTHLIMLECKGVTGWTNAQFLSKVCRLKRYFGGNGDNFAGAIPHFGLVSPKNSKGLKVETLPKWMLPNGCLPWMKLDIPHGLVSITRCDQAGSVSNTGKYWRLHQGFAYGKQPVRIV